MRPCGNVISSSVGQAPPYEFWFFGGNGELKRDPALEVRVNHRMHASVFASLRRDRLRGFCVMGMWGFANRLKSVRIQAGWGVFVLFGFFCCGQERHICVNGDGVRGALEG